MAKKTLSILAALTAAVPAMACAPFFPASFIDSENADLTQFSGREQMYHLSLLYEHFMRAEAPPSPRSTEKDPVGPRLEYELYKAGLKETADNPECYFPEAWKKLLALPPAERRYRTLRTYYMLGNIALYHQKNEESAYKFYQQLRREAAAGIPDNLGLSHDSVNKPFSDDPYLRCRSMAMKARYGIPSILHIDWNSDEELQELLKDPFMAEVLLLAHPEKIGKLNGNRRFLLADRLAVRAFSAGNMQLCQNLLRQAPDHSLLKLYLQARFARRDGDYKKSAKYLRRWLKLYDEKEGKCPPEMKFLRQNSHDKTAFSWQQEVHGVLGLVSIDSKDFQEALLCFINAGSWHDAALIAERYLSAAELAAFYDQNVQPDDMYIKLNYLLARRMLREERFSQVSPCAFPSKLGDAVKEYIQCRQKAADLKLSEEERAKNWFRAGQILLRYNIELVGYELAPDFFIANGNFPEYPPYRKLRKPDLPRFHYRKTIADCFKEAARLTKDNDMRYLSYLAAGWTLRNNSPKEADYFYKAIAGIPNYPASKVLDDLRWFPQPGKDWRENFHEKLNPFDTATLKPYIEKTDTAFRQILANRRNSPKEAESR